MVDNFNTSYMESLINLSQFKLKNRSNAKVTEYGFLMKVYDLYRRVLGLKEYQFSTQCLNASRDYYAMIKNTKNEVGSEKLQALLVNTRALVEHLRRHRDAESELMKLYIKEATLCIDDLDMYFANTEKRRLNTTLVERMKTSDVVVMV